jgi:hypothetical protein
MASPPSEPAVACSNNASTSASAGYRRAGVAFAEHDAETSIRRMAGTGTTKGEMVIVDQAVRERLDALGCDAVQRYRIGMPMPMDQFKAWEGEWSKSGS